MPALGDSPAVPEGFTRILEDCERDFGPSTGKAHELGHNILALDVVETHHGGDVNDPVLMFRFSYNYATGVVVNQVPNQNLVSFETPREQHWTLLDTTSNSDPVFVAGVEPVALDLQRSVAYGEGSGSHHVIEFSYRYRDLEIQNGEALSNFSVLGYYSPTSTSVPEEHYDWRKGDLAPGGFYLPNGDFFEGCWRSQDFDPERDRRYQAAVDYVVTASNWRPPESPNTPPIAAFTFTPQEPEELQTISFTDHSMDSDGTIEHWHWDFGDGNTSTVRNAFHQYARPGQYVVTLTVTDDDGDTGEVSALILVTPKAPNEPPVADFTWDPEHPVPGENILFTSHSYDPDGHIVEWEWDLGDGNSSDLEDPAHVYEEAGEYSVTLVVHDDAGSIGMLTRTVEVVGNHSPPEPAPPAPLPPRAAFHFPDSDLVAGQWILFTDLSLHPTGTILSWSWDFGDGKQSTQRHPHHAYKDAGTYLVTLKVHDHAGLSNTTARTLLIHEPETVEQDNPPKDDGSNNKDDQDPSSTEQDTVSLVPGFIVETEEPRAGTPVRFTETTSGGVVLNRTWDFGDGRTSTTADPSHVYHEPGTFTVSLHVTDPNGDHAKTQQTLVVAPAQTPSVTQEGQESAGSSEEATSDPPDDAGAGEDGDSHADSQGGPGDVQEAHALGIGMALLLIGGSLWTRTRRNPTAHWKKDTIKETME